MIYCGSRWRNAGGVVAPPKTIWPPPSFRRMVVTALQGDRRQYGPLWVESGHWLWAVDRTLPDLRPADVVCSPNEARRAHIRRPQHRRLAGKWLRIDDWRLHDGRVRRSSAQPRRVHRGRLPEGDNRRSEDEQSFGERDQTLFRGATKVMQEAGCLGGRFRRAYRPLLRRSTVADLRGRGRGSGGMAICGPLRRLARVEAQGGRRPWADSTLTRVRLGSGTVIGVRPETGHSLRRLRWNRAYAMRVALQKCYTLRLPQI